MLRRSLLLSIILFALSSSTFAVVDTYARPGGLSETSETRLSTDPASDGYFDALSLRSLRTPVVSVGDVAVIERDIGQVPADFPIVLSCAVPSDVSLGFVTSDGTALAGVDYEATSGMVVVPAGSTSSVAPVPVIGDTFLEDDELAERSGEHRGQRAQGSARRV